LRHAGMQPVVLKAVAKLQAHLAACQEN